MNKLALMKRIFVLVPLMLCACRPPESVTVYFAPAVGQVNKGSFDLGSTIDVNAITTQSGGQVVNGADILPSQQIVLNLHVEQTDTVDSINSDSSINIKTVGQVSMMITPSDGAEAPTQAIPFTSTLVYPTNGVVQVKDIQFQWPVVIADTNGQSNGLQETLRSLFGYWQNPFPCYNRALPKGRVVDVDTALPLPIFNSQNLGLEYVTYKLHSSCVYKGRSADGGYEVELRQRVDAQEVSNASMAVYRRTKVRVKLSGKETKGLVTLSKDGHVRNFQKPLQLHMETNVSNSSLAVNFDMNQGITTSGSYE